MFLYALRSFRTNAVLKRPSLTQFDTDPSRCSVSVIRVVEVASKCLLRALVRKEEHVGVKVASTWQNDGK